MILMMLLVVTAQKAQAQDAITWNAEFYSNASFIGPLAMARQDSAIAFDWATGSPGIGITSDNFSARWTADPYFTASTYHFYAFADDGLCIWVDFQPVLNTLT